MLPQRYRREGTEGSAGWSSSFVQAAGGDVEMLRSTECAYRFKVNSVPALQSVTGIVSKRAGPDLSKADEQSSEVPSVFHDLFQH